MWPGIHQIHLRGWGPSCLGGFIRKGVPQLRGHAPFLWGTDAVTKRVRVGDPLYSPQYTHYSMYCQTVLTFDAVLSSRGAAAAGAVVGILRFLRTWSHSWSVAKRHPFVDALMILRLKDWNGMDGWMELTPDPNFLEFHPLNIQCTLQPWFLSLGVCTRQYSGYLD